MIREIGCSWVLTVKKRTGLYGRLYGSWFGKIFHSVHFNLSMFAEPITRLLLSWWGQTDCCGTGPEILQWMMDVQDGYNCGWRLPVVGVISWCPPSSTQLDKMTSRLTSCHILTTHLNVFMSIRNANIVWDKAQKSLMNSLIRFFLKTHPIQDAGNRILISEHWQFKPNQARKASSKVLLKWSSGSS